MSAEESTESLPEQAPVSAEDSTVAVQTQTLEELTEETAEQHPIGLEDLLDVPVRVTVQIGRTRMTLAELVELGPGSVVTLDREAHEPADILGTGTVIGRGEVVTIDDTSGVRSTYVHRDECG
jgi:flagellar motor switch protein FliN/FliY